MAAVACTRDVEGHVPWSRAWSAAIATFYPHGHGAAEAHFPTAVTDGTAVAEAVLQRAVGALESLVAGGITVTDVGASDGTLIRQLMDRWPQDWQARTSWRGIDLRSRPAALEPGVEWVRGDVDRGALDLAPRPGLVLAHELLDDLPCEVLEVDDRLRLRLVLVDPATGHEILGPNVDDDRDMDGWGVDSAAIRQWCARWWPRREPAARIECGYRRDRAWQRLTGLVSVGMVIGMDYGHVRPERAAGVWDGGTLAAYRRGRLVTPVPDGSCNITAHVAIDACASSSPGTVLVAPRSHAEGRTPDGLWWLVHGTMTP